MLGLCFALLFAQTVRQIRQLFLATRCVNTLAMVELNLTGIVALVRAVNMCVGVFAVS